MAKQLHKIHAELTMATPEQMAIEKAVNEIWDTYDINKSGDLDKEELKKFAKDAMGRMGIELDEEKFESQFDSEFQAMDLNKNGVIEKSEMQAFIKKLQSRL